MNTASRVLAVAALVVATAGPARADVVGDWNEKAVAAGYTARSGNNIHTKNIAIMNLAMFEALNSIEPRYTPYRARLAADAGASREAAAATAAHHSLVRLFPEQSAEFDKALQASLANVAEGPAKAAGIRLGEQAAAAMLADRNRDGADASNTYRPHTTPGAYVPTILPAFSSWSSVRPFGMKTGDAVRPPAPYGLGSTQWARDFEEVRKLGAKSGSTRTPEQTQIGRFWDLTGPATYNPVVRHMSAVKSLDMLDNARLFALVSIAAADAAIAVFDAKYAYGFWRPITAIRNADQDGNDATQRDAAWESLIGTPMHPEYPCAHCIFQGAAAGVLQVLYGNAVPVFSLTSTTLPGVTRSFSRLSDLVNEVINARIYGGVHYRTSGEVGASMGQRIAESTVQNYLTPTRRADGSQ